MILESKYNLKDKIYWLESNKVRHAIIKAIQFPRIHYDMSISKGECMYFVSKSVKSSVINWNGGGLYEHQIFISKKDLLKSL